MQRKKSLFLLEIVIAMTLVGFFSVYFLRSSLHHLYKEREALLDLEFEWVKDLNKMEVLTEGWPKEGVFKEQKIVKKTPTVTLDKRSYSREYSYKLTVAAQHEEAFKLKLREQEGQETGRNYYFLAPKTPPKPPLKVDS